GGALPGSGRSGGVAFGLPSASMTAARLHGNLAVLRGDLAGAEESFAAAWQLARGLSLPFQLALLERDDGRRLRRAGDRPKAVTRLRQARSSRGPWSPPLCDRLRA